MRTLGILFQISVTKFLPLTRGRSESSILYRACKVRPAALGSLEVHDTDRGMLKAAEGVVADTGVEFEVTEEQSYIAWKNCSCQIRKT